jgi:uncharacterized protein
MTVALIPSQSDQAGPAKSEPRSGHALGLPTVQEINFLSPKIRQVLNAFREELETLYGGQLANLVLYGSVARHDETAASDIDVLVVLEGEVNPVQEIDRVGDAKLRMLLEYDELVSVVPTSQDNFLHRDSMLLRNIRQEGILF